MNALTARIIEEVNSIPLGKVCTYGDIARRAGNPRAARRVARVLHQYSQSMNLPWHRVLGAGGRIRLKPGSGFEDQVVILRSEEVEVRVLEHGTAAIIDLRVYGF